MGVINGPMVLGRSVDLGHGGALVFSPCYMLVNKGIIGKEAEVVGFTCEGPAQGPALESAGYWRWWWGANQVLENCCVVGLHQILVRSCRVC